MQPRWTAGRGGYSGSGRAGRLARSVSRGRGTQTDAFSLLQKTPNKPQKLPRLLFSCAGRAEKSRTFETPFYSCTPRKRRGLLLYSPAHPGAIGRKHAPSAAHELSRPSASRRVEPGLSEGCFLLPYFYSTAWAVKL